jgi:hypothetical protein
MDETDIIKYNTGNHLRRAYFYSSLEILAMFVRVKTYDIFTIVIPSSQGSISQFVYFLKRPHGQNFVVVYTCQKFASVPEYADTRMLQSQHPGIACSSMLSLDL